MEDFNKRNKYSCLSTTSHPIFLFDKKDFRKIVFYNEIKKINYKRPDLYNYNLKDIIKYDFESLQEFSILLSNSRRKNTTKIH